MMRKKHWSGLSVDRRKNIDYQEKTGRLTIKESSAIFELRCKKGSYRVYY